MVKKLLLFCLLLCFIAVSCEKDFLNPYDRECPADIWTPENLKAELTAYAIVLTWTQEEKHFDGFRLEYQLDSLAWRPLSKELLPAGQHDYADSLLRPGRTVSYRIYALADKNTSDTCYSNSIFVALELPLVVLNEVTHVDSTSASLLGEVLSDGGSSVTARGFCCDTLPMPGLDSPTFNAGKGLGAFSFDIEGLLPGTSYYVRAYATNEVGTAYSEPVKLTTSSMLALVLTNDVSETGSSSATLNGTVVSDGGAPVSERGFCYSSSELPDTVDTKVLVGSGTGSFSEAIAGLQPGTTYYVRAYAINSQGIVYGEQKSFTTGSTLAVVVTNNVSDVNSTSANLNGEVTSDGGAAVSERGFCFSTSAMPDQNDTKILSGKGMGAFSSSVINLKPGTTYYVRAYAINSQGVVYGEQKSFTTGTALPVVVTNYVSDVNTTSAKLNGEVTSDGGAAVSERGFCYSTSVLPDKNDTKVLSGKGMGEFSSSVINLKPGTTYYVRAYAINNLGIVYGEQKTFTTGTSLAVVKTFDATEINSTSALLNGEVLSDGGAAVSERGFCYSTTSSPDINDSKITSGAGTGPFNSPITSLKPGTIYYVRAYALNDQGTAYGETKSFTTDATLAVVETNNATGVNSTSAVLNGDVLSDGGAAVSERGFCYSTSGLPDINDTRLASGTGTGPFNHTLINLKPGTTYYVRAYAINSKGTAYGEQKSFTTKSTVALVLTYGVSGISTSSADLNGEVLSDGGAEVTERGFCYSTTSLPDINDIRVTSGTGTGPFNSTAINLNPGTTYYVRAYAVNSKGTAFGEQKSFTTEASLAIVITNEVSDVGVASAHLNGEVVSDGGGAVTERGFFYATTILPDGSDTKVTAGSGSGVFSKEITGLQPGTTYYIRAYAVNSKGIAYGEQKSFTTETTLPDVLTHEATGISSSSASLNGEVVSDGGTAVTECGFYYDTSGSPDANDTKVVAGSGLGPFSKEITGLQPGTTYYVKAYASSGKGTVYGTLKSFTTGTSFAVVETNEAVGINSSSATLNGEVLTDGGAVVTERGFCYATSLQPDLNDTKVAVGSGIGTFNQAITGLQPGTVYHVRAYAINANGTTYGQQKDFTTDAVLPTVVTNEVSEVTGKTASLNGEVLSDGGAAVTERGFCYSTSFFPDVNDIKVLSGNGTGLYSSTVINLNPGTTYFVRAYAINSKGITYGDQKMFITFTSLADVLTNDVTWSSTTTAILAGEVVSDGGTAVTERGFCYSSSEMPDINDLNDIKVTTGAGKGAFSSSIINLIPGNFYYVRAYAINGIGIAYGDQKVFTTGITQATVHTYNTSDISSTSATFNGEVVSDGGAEVTERGFCYSILKNPDVYSSKVEVGSGLGSFSKVISGLQPATIYYVRAYAISSKGTVYGEQNMFMTEATLPVVATTDVTGIGMVSATLNGLIVSDGGATLKERGFYYSTSPMPDVNDTKVPSGLGDPFFSSVIINLEPGTTYYVRAFARNNLGIVYGEQKEFTTLSP